MSFKEIFNTNRTAASGAVLAVAAGLSGCVTMDKIPFQITPPTAAANLPAVHPAIKPQSCRLYEAQAARIPGFQTVSRGFGNLAGAVYDIATGNTRSAEQSGRRATVDVVTGAGQQAVTQASLDTQWAFCARDLNALYQKGGLCATTGTQNATQATMNGQVAGAAQGRITQTQMCQSASSYAGPNLMVTPQQQVAPSNAPAATPSCVIQNGLKYCR